MAMEGNNDAARPVRETERIEVLDVLRGFAIFGIFMVNIGLFSMPLMEFLQGIHGTDVPQSEVVSAAIVKIFFEYKFVTLFSFLFGAGMILQLTRMRDRGVPYVGVYLRRTFLLLVIGSIHAWLIWYGDILFIYAWVALLVLAVWKVPPKGMMIIAALFLALGVIMTSGFLTLQVIGTQMQAEQQNAAVDDAASDVETDETSIDAETESTSDDDAEDSEAPAEVDEVAASADQSFGAFMEELGSAWGDMQTGPETLTRLETRVYSEGPLTHALGMRISTWISMLLFSVVLSGFGVRAIAMFILGGALMKLGFHRPEHRRIQTILAVVGLTVGISGETLSWYLAKQAGMTPSYLMVGAESLRYFTSMILCMGYVATICALVNAGVLRWLQHAIASVGRMAFTNYIGQSLIATGVFYWWGLGKFGTFSRPEQLMFVVSIYVGQIIFSVIWLRIFRIGPLEWLWRSATYLKLQPLRR